jgi:tetratricopeptide (TPR) repeat protein
MLGIVSMADERDYATVTLGVTEGGGGADSLALHPGTTLGRYRLRSLLGAGGMGVVFLADDPSLDRTVAIKVLYPGRAGRLVDDDRLIREGQVMAQLTHPNVIRVYDVGHDGMVSFVAMEHVRGPTLKAWLEERPRALAEVLDVFVQAGRGLAAAHAAGLVHGEFKPANVMIDHDGRVVVTDFGLARRAGADGGAATADGPPVVSLEQTASEAAGVCGTAAYMAPEQHVGAATDARSDVFSFCVALWRAVYQQPPFPGETWASLAAATRSGALLEPPADRRIPAYVRAALERGLCVEPNQRWPAMEPLLAALSTDPARRRRRVARASALVVAVGLLSAALAARVSTRRNARELACGSAPGRFSGVWDADSRAQVRAAMLATGEPQAALTFDVVARGHDRRLEAWEAMRRESCEASKIRHEQSDTAFDLRGACLDRQLAEIGAFVRALRAPTKAVLYGAVDAVSAVGDVSICSDAVMLARRLPLPSDVERRRAIGALEPKLIALRAQVDLDQPLADRPAALARLDEARKLDYPPLTALALLVVGRDEAIGHHAAEAERLLEEAMVQAELGGDDALRFELELQLGLVVGLDLDRFDEGVRHLELAEALRKRTGAGAPREARVLDAMALLEMRRGRLPAAEALARRALALNGEAGQADSERAKQLLTLGAVLVDADRPQEAEQVLSQSVAIAERVLGPRHPRVANALMMRSGAYRRMHKWEAAERDLQRTLEIFETAYGPESLNVAVAMANRALLSDSRHQYDEAERNLRRALAIYSKVYGPDHSRTMRLLSRVGITLVSARRLDEAEPILRTALDGLIRVLGKNHRYVSDVYFELGKLEEKRHHPRKALEHYAAAAASLRAGEGPGSKLLRRVYASMGDVHKDDLKQYAAACADYAAGIAVAGQDPTGGSHRATLEINYADALVHVGKRPEALAHAMTARQLLVQIGEREKDYLAEVDKWLAQHFPAEARQLATTKPAVR